MQPGTIKGSALECIWIANFRADARRFVLSDRQLLDSRENETPFAAKRFTSQLLSNASRRTGSPRAPFREIHKTPVKLS